MPISKFAFVRLTVVLILLGLLALMTIVGATVWLIDDAQDNFRTLTATRLQRGALIDFRVMLDDAETGQRGYLLTGNREYLKPYLDVRDKIPAGLERLRTFVNADETQRNDVQRLTAVTADKLAELRETVELYDRGEPEQALSMVNAGRGKRLMDEAREIFNRQLARVDELVAEGVMHQRVAIERVWWTTLGGALVILIVVGGSVWTVIAYTRQLVAAENEVRLLNAGLEERVRERTMDLRRANEEIQRFAYIVTHDLRAPLVNIMGFTSELATSLKDIQAHLAHTSEQTPEAAAARTAAETDAPEAIEFIRSSTKKMDGLINAILKLSREGRRTLRPEVIDLGSMLDAAAANVRHQVLDAGGDIAFAGSVRPVVSDRLALEQVFGNLLDNAVKYRSPDRPLQIVIRTRDEYGRILVEFEDNGRGIAQQDHERVFELFRRSGSQDVAGEGIGLAHVRSMVRNLGGDITLKSDLGRGTTMTVSLPHDLRQILGANA
jgi:signal transduction histidine kinase